MIVSHDIFRVEAGGVRWLECVTSLDEATARVRQIAGGAAGEYIVVNQRTGNRVFLKFDGINWAGRASADSLSKSKGN